MYCTRLAENTGHKNRQNSPSGHHRTTLSGCIFTTKACIDNQKKNKLIKQQYFLQMSWQYGELRPISGWDRFTSLGHPANFNRLRVLASLLQRRRSPEANQTLHDLWSSPELVHYIYIYTFLGVFALPLIEFCHVQNSLWSKSCVLVYWQRYYTALQQRASAKLCGAVQGMELRKFRRRRHLYSARRPSRWHRPTF